MRKREKAMILFGVVIAIIGIILIINYYQNNYHLDRPTALCIANKSSLIVSKTCGHCAEQKRILGEHLSVFEVIYTDEHPEVFSQYNLIGVPTWIIDGRMYPGVQNVRKLKQITGC